MIKLLKVSDFKIHSRNQITNFEFFKVNMKNSNGVLRSSQLTVSNQVILGENPTTEIKTDVRLNLNSDLSLKLRRNSILKKTLSTNLSKPP